MNSEQINTSLVPIGYPTVPAGYVASVGVPDNLKKTTVKEYLNNPLILTKLTDRVYELLLQDLRCQQERVRNYGYR